ncbi:MAG: tRNA (adenosine(37)-N6)-threonylcarbamoyltransferase complex dimerization subunit type 1 TsaB [Tissierellia bacterium]|nr:tRNA (adenosine(37)-N6)-threonylcarbamoyltransferase complex dimerization subunit type 1 TsaB [Tissierellia bacterium]
MKILGIDTSTMTTSIALVEDDKILGQIMLTANMSHSEHLMDTIDFLLRSSEISIRDIDLFAVAIGPGSFTGIRIGISTVKSFAQSLKKEVVGVSTLEVLAANQKSYKHIASIIDARRNRVYGGIYKSIDGVLENVLPEDIYQWEDFYVELQKYEDIVVLGDCIDIHLEDLEKANLNISYGDDNLARASNLCELAKSKYDRGLVDDCDSINANYMGKSQAQIDFEKRSENV